MIMRKRKLYFITDSTLCSEERLLEIVESAIRGGAVMVQLREKAKSTESYIALAKKVHSITSRYSVPLIIDDRVDVALAANAEGVHVGKEDMPVALARQLMGPEKIVGATTKTVPDAIAAIENGADYLGVGAIYPTTTKVKTVLTSVETLKSIVSVAHSYHIPEISPFSSVSLNEEKGDNTRKNNRIEVYAIGGLNSKNIEILEGSGIDGICVVSAIMKAEDAEAAARELSSHIRPCALTIAASDSGGNAGIEADLRAFHALGVHGCTVHTALTAQNPFAVSAIETLPVKFIEAELSAVLGVYNIRSIKTGMLPTTPIIQAVANALASSKDENLSNLVIDPVMIATSGARLIEKNAIKTLKDKLIPLASLITPNIPEAEELSEITIKTENDAKNAAEAIFSRFGTKVLIKGGHAIGDTSDKKQAKDILFNGNDFSVFEMPVIENPISTHGTGCSLSAAIAACLAQGLSLADAITRAKRYVHGAIASSYLVGRDCGVLGVPNEFLH